MQRMRCRQVTFEGPLSDLKIYCFKNSKMTGVNVVTLLNRF